MSWILSILIVMATILVISVFVWAAVKHTVAFVIMICAALIGVAVYMVHLAILSYIG